MWTKLETSTKETLIYKHSKSSEECKLSLIHDGEMGTFYIFDNPLQMPFQRKYAFDIIQQHENLGLSKDEIIEELSKITAQNNDPNMVFYLAETLKTKIKDSWDFAKTSTFITALLIIEENESIDFFTQESALEKVNKWSKDSVMLGFFLSIAQKSINNLTQSFNPNL